MKGVRSAGLLAVTVLAAIALLRAGLAVPASFLIVSDPLVQSDAVAPLAGERSRVDAASALLLAGYARRFAVTDMWAGVEKPALNYGRAVSDQAVEAGVSRSQIIVGRQMVATTYQEAVELRRIAEEQRWNSLIVVTSTFHARRARLILGDAFAGTGIRISVQVVPGHWYSADNWWTTAEGRLVTVEEYLKLALYLAGYERQWTIQGALRTW